MSVESVVNFVNAIITNRLLTPDQQNVMTKELVGRIRDSRALAKELMQRGWLTVYQVNQIFQNNARDLVLGPYRILDLLGEGGLSRVFRAYHTNKRCVVALKVVRKEFLSHPDAVHQFQQESRTIAQLSHPNIIQTIEADQISSTHFMAMEFIEGLDLAKLVRLSGPLPIPQASDFIRQAALGLQHAHERCLVHRDIKPANLFLVTPPGVKLPSAGDPASIVGGVVKILDWGLANMRLPAATGQVEPANTLMREETVGTADYLAPEQAVDASSVDIRADIYSLGCSFYYLLAGQPPYAGGGLMQKLIKHREAPPPSILEVRPEAHPQVAQIIARMMAKKAADRYRTPASVVAALMPLCKSMRPAGRPESIIVPPKPASAPTDDPASDAPPSEGPSAPA